MSMTPREYADALWPDIVIGEPPAQFVAAARDFEARRTALPNDAEELSHQLMLHFFPDSLRFINREGWGNIFREAMKPNAMGVTGVVIGDPIMTDCIALARRLCQ